MNPQQNIQGSTKKNLTYVTDYNKCLGQGQFGKVYSGVIQQTQKEIAIKFCKKDKAQEQQLQNEMDIYYKTMQLCQHNENILQVVDVIESDEFNFIITEKCKCNLFDYTKQKICSEAEILDIAIQVLNGLSFLHQSRIVHRDIKPENILVQDDQTKPFKVIYKICDLGVSKQGDQLKTMIGTLPYMAPEFFFQKGYDSSVDLWALGILLDELVHKKLYFFDPVQLQLAKKITNEVYQFAPVEGFTLFLKDILENQLVNKNPKERKSTSDILIKFQEHFNQLAYPQPNIQVFNQPIQLNKPINQQLDMDFTNIKSVEKPIDNNNQQGGQPLANQNIEIPLENSVSISGEQQEVYKTIQPAINNNQINQAQQQQPQGNYGQQMNQQQQNENHKYQYKEANNQGNNQQQQISKAYSQKIIDQQNNEVKENLSKSTSQFQLQNHKPINYENIQQQLNNNSIDMKNENVKINQNNILKYQKDFVNKYLELYYKSKPNN